MDREKLTEFIIENKQTLTFLILILLVCISLFTIGYVTYRFFFWVPPEIPSTELLIVNISNLTGW
jgi:hypothetical protein